MDHNSSEPPRRDSDIRLMLRVRDGDDPAAFSELVERFQRRLVARLRRHLGSAHEAEDLAQDVFLRVYRARKTYTPGAQFSTWLFTIARHLSLNALRDRHRRPVRPLDGDDSEPPAPARDDPPAHTLQQQELAEVIRRALAGLTERQRAAIVLNKFEDLGYEDIAVVLGTSTKAVKSTLCRARSKLREALQDHICAGR